MARVPWPRGLISKLEAGSNDETGQLPAAMQAITASSKRTSDIIDVVDGIAFQTNTLALNAAVEALATPAVRCKTSSTRSGA